MTDTDKLLADMKAKERKVNNDDSVYEAVSLAICETLRKAIGG